MVGPTYWGYATGSAGLNLQVMGSTDLVHWGLVSDPVPVLPAWSEPGHTWAPGVVRLAAGFVMYYTVRDGPSGRQCIPVARSPTPQGPFTDASAAPFVYQRDHGGSIDPSPFLGPDGSLFLIWKSDDRALGQPSLGGVRPRASIVAITPSATGAGYWLVGADGGVLSFGDARFQGSLRSTRLVKPITGLSGAPGPLVMGGA